MLKMLNTFLTFLLEITDIPKNNTINTIIEPAIK